MRPRPAMASAPAPDPTPGPSLGQPAPTPAPGPAPVLGLPAPRPRGKKELRTAGFKLGTQPHGAVEVPHFPLNEGDLVWYRRGWREIQKYGSHSSVGRLFRRYVEGGDHVKVLRIQRYGDDAPGHISASYYP